ncbi:MAG: hypothetical protein AAFV46_07435 [Cyanobacteria bacterium J06635_11]
MPNDFDVLFQYSSEPAKPAPAEPAIAPKPVAKAEPKTPRSAAKKKRGRPATGKRSDEGWISRAFYVEETTDIDLEAELTQLRREGVKLDKSELVNSCLIAWLKWRKGDQPSKCLGEISSRRKSD